MEQRVHLYCFQKSGMAAAQAGSTRTFAAADRIPRGKRGGAGRKELGGEGETHSPSLSGSTPQNSQEATDSADRERWPHN